jgi:beta-lactamase superfamily II metal-dependent hydrolase
MEAKITFFNLGNADTSLIRISPSGKTVLWDYADMRGEKHCDLPTELNKRITEEYYDVVCFTHADEDHVKGMSKYFYLEYAELYQKGDRKKIKELWIPAAWLLESRNDLCSDATILKAEAKYRLLTLKSKIKIFSKPDALKEWVEKEGVKFSEIEHLIVDAGKCVQGWDKKADGVEFFVHSPFKGHVDENEVIDRNTAAILVQAVFGNKPETKLILGGDADSDNLKDIVRMSKYRKNSDRLKWDLLHLFHHCSYKALNKDEKGKTKTTPVTEVKWLMETQGQKNCVIISPSEIIPVKETDQPPHMHAHSYYKEDVCDKKGGKIIVTMEHPSKEKPGPVEMEINDEGFTVLKKVLTEEEKREAARTISKTSIVTGNHANS